jgi:hypothetical protein
MRTLPTFVTRILDDLGQSHLAGDLAEEVPAGRSSAWVWWQVSAAVMRGVVSTFRTHPYLTFRAAALGWILLQLLNGQLPFSPHPEVRGWIYNSPVAAILIAAQYFSVGWVIARMHQQHRTALVLASGLFLMVTNGVDVVGRILIVTLMQPTGIAFPSGIGLLVWVVYTAVLLLLPLFVIVGGLWAPGISRQSKPIRG